MNGSTMANETGVERPEEILGLLREQCSLYGRLESFAATQRSLVRADDTAPLLSLLADRQRLSAELTLLANRLAPIRRSWTALRERFSPSQRTEADNLISEVAQRLRKVIESDEKDARVLSVRKQNVVTSLHAAHRVGEAMQAYRTPPDGTLDSDRLDEAT